MAVFEGTYSMGPVQNIGSLKLMRVDFVGTSGNAVATSSAGIDYTAKEFGFTVVKEVAVKNDTNYSVSVDITDEGHNFVLTSLAQVDCADNCSATIIGK